MQKRPLITVKSKSSSFPIKSKSVESANSIKSTLLQDAQKKLKVDSLGFCLLGAAQVLTQVLTGVALPSALTKTFRAMDAPLPARGAIQDIAYRSMRQMGRAEALLELMISKAPESRLLHGLLCCSLSLMLPHDDELDMPYEMFTIVNQAVLAAASHVDMVYAKGMVNAVLRRFLREQESLTKAILQQPQALWNYPTWWINATKLAYPSDWQTILTNGNTAPPLTLRVNRRKTTLSAYLDSLAEQGILAHQIGPDALRLDKPVPVQHIPGFADGWVSVQDAAAQLAMSLLDVQDGMRVLDACAAPGGKTGHILESANLLELTALDVDAQRLSRVAENLQRLQLSATLKVGDARGQNWWDGQLFDRILVDAPCTASGVVRRHPDIRWLRRKGDTLHLAALSAQILDNLWRMLRPDGKLLFVTCSLWPQESEGQAAAFVARHQAHRLPAPGQLLPTVNKEQSQMQDYDGLFYALFQKPVN